jgi:hypothetical protein
MKTTVANIRNVEETNLEQNDTFEQKRPKYIFVEEFFFIVFVLVLNERSMPSTASRY